MSNFHDSSLMKKFYKIVGNNPAVVINNERITARMYIDLFSVSTPITYDQEKRIKDFLIKKKCFNISFYGSHGVEFEYDKYDELEVFDYVLNILMEVLDVEE